LIQTSITRIAELGWTKGKDMRKRKANKVAEQALKKVRIETQQQGIITDLTHELIIMIVYSFFRQWNCTVVYFVEPGYLFLHGLRILPPILPHQPSMPSTSLCFPMFFQTLCPQVQTIQTSSLLWSHQGGRHILCQQELFQISPFIHHPPYHQILRWPPSKYHSPNIQRRNEPTCW